jgi:methyl-accepting chemotaxis protein
MSGKSEFLLDALKRGLVQIEFSLSGEITYVNQLGLDLTGFCAEDLIGKPQSVLMDVEELKHLNYSRMWEEIAAGQVRDRCHRYIGKAGNILWLQSSFLPVRDQDGQVVSAVQVGMNITLQQQR